MYYVKQIGPMKWVVMDKDSVIVATTDQGFHANRIALALEILDKAQGN